MKKNLFYSGKILEEMTHQKAIHILNSFNLRSVADKYDDIALDLATDALEKQIPKKPIEDGYYDLPCVCPNCGSNVANEADNDYQFEYCYHCGQKIDWSDTE